MKRRHMTVGPLVLIGLLSGCATAGDPASKSHSQLVLDLRKSCIEAAGGARMDAVDVYGGRLSSACTAWAYQRARQLPR